MNPFVLLAASIIGNFLTLTILRDPSATAFWHKIAFPNAIAPPSERLIVPILARVPGLDPVINCIRADQESLESCLPGFFRRIEQAMGDSAEAVMRGVVDSRCEPCDTGSESVVEIIDEVVVERVGNGTEVPLLQEPHPPQEHTASRGWDFSSILFPTLLYALCWLSGLFFLVWYLLELSNAVDQLGNRLDYRIKVIEDRTEILEIPERLLSGLSWPESSKVADQHGLDEFKSIVEALSESVKEFNSQNFPLLEQIALKLELDQPLDEGFFSPKTEIKKDETYSTPRIKSEADSDKKQLSKVSSQTDRPKRPNPPKLFGDAIYPPMDDIGNPLPPSPTIAVALRRGTRRQNSASPNLHSSSSPEPVKQDAVASPKQASPNSGLQKLQETGLRDALTAPEDMKEPCPAGSSSIIAKSSSEEQSLEYEREILEEDSEQRNQHGIVQRLVKKFDRRKRREEKNAHAKKCVVS